MESSKHGFQPRLTAKSWGFELLWAHTPHYAAKLLFVRAGERLSLQHHTRRIETYYALSGELELIIRQGKRLVATSLIIGTAVEIAPGVLHRLIARTDGWFVEILTPELDEFLRVSNEYDRVEWRIRPRRQWRSKRRWRMA